MSDYTLYAQNIHAAINLSSSTVIDKLAKLEGFEARWEILYPLKSRLAELLQPAFQINADWEEELIDPSKLMKGDLISSNGYVAKIDEVKIYHEDGRLPCYVFKCVYVAGDLKMFTSRRGSINNGTSVDYRSHEQGNRLARFYKADITKMKGRIS